MKTLLITMDFPPRKGGVAVYLDQIAAAYPDRIFVLASPEKGSEAHDAKANYAIERKALFYRLLWPKWIKVVFECIRRRKTYDQILVSHMLPFGTAALIASRFTKKPYMVIVHGMDVGLASKGRKHWLAKQVLSHAKLVVANSRALEREVREAFGAKRTRVVYPCIPPKQCEKKEHDGFRILSIGRLITRKGFARVLNTLNTIRVQGYDFHYDIVGDGPELASLKSRAEHLGLGALITFHTDADDSKKDALLAGTDLFIMTPEKRKDDREGFGIVYLEAAQCGIPSIATNMPGVNEAVLHDETGILIKTEEELADAIRRMHDDEALRSKLGEAAKKRAQTMFACEEQISKLNDVL